MLGAFELVASRFDLFPGDRTDLEKPFLFFKVRGCFSQAGRRPFVVEFRFFYGKFGPRNLTFKNTAIDDREAAPFLHELACFGDRLDNAADRCADRSNPNRLARGRTFYRDPDRSFFGDRVLYVRRFRHFLFAGEERA